MRIPASHSLCSIEGVLPPFFEARKLSNRQIENCTSCELDWFSEIWIEKWLRSAPIIIRDNCKYLVLSMVQYYYCRAIIHHSSAFIPTIHYSSSIILSNFQSNHIRFRRLLVCVAIPPVPYSAKLIPICFCVSKVTLVGPRARPSGQNLGNRDETVFPSRCPGLDETLGLS